MATTAAEAASQLGLASLLVPQAQAVPQPAEAGRRALLALGPKLSLAAVLRPTIAVHPEPVHLSVHCAVLHYPLYISLDTTRGNLSL